MKVLDVAAFVTESVTESSPLIQLLKIQDLTFCITYSPFTASGILLFSLSEIMHMQRAS